KLGGQIELIRVQAPLRLILGEGVETVLAVWKALACLRRDLDHTAFTSGIDLGNLGGRALEAVAHPSLRTAAGRPQRVPGPEPDISAPAIAISETVKEIVLLGDGDSDRFLTECALQRAARRYARPDRIVKIAWAPDGRDFNDVLLRVAS